VKPREEIQKRSFWRRFFSSFLSLLKEKRPSETKEERAPRRGAELPLPLLKEKRPPEAKWGIAKSDPRLQARKSPRRY